MSLVLAATLEILPLLRTGFSYLGGCRRLPRRGRPTGKAAVRAAELARLDLTTLVVLALGGCAIWMALQAPQVAVAISFGTAVIFA